MSNNEKPEKPELPIVLTEEWDKFYWAYNVPLQMWRQDDGNYRVVNYMPRREDISSLDEYVTPDQLPQFCQNAAIILRNLADLFETMGKGEINFIYYPTELPAEAIAKQEE